MTFIIAEPCIDRKEQSCVAVCPVDCIHEVDRMLVINTDECIDCGACEPECPFDAIFTAHDLPEKWEEFAAINTAIEDGATTVNRMVAEYVDRHPVDHSDDA